jgi:hypothetical protein
MTKRYYNKLAALIAREVDEFPYDPSNILSLLMLARKLCTLFTKQNPQFDRKRFLHACGLYDFKITQLKRDIEDHNESIY